MEFTFEPQALIPAPKRKWWQLLRDKILRRPDPEPTAPPGTQAFLIELEDGSRVYMPAVRIQELAHPVEWPTSPVAVEFDIPEIDPAVIDTLFGQDLTDRNFRP